MVNKYDEDDEYDGKAGRSCHAQFYRQASVRSTCRFTGGCHCAAAVILTDNRLSLICPGCGIIRLLGLQRENTEIYSVTQLSSRL